MEEDGKERLADQLYCWIRYKWENEQVERNKQGCVVKVVQER